MNDKTAEAIAQIDQPGRVTWHSSGPDEGPDVGLSFGLGNGTSLYVGEMPRRLWEACPSAQSLGPDAGWWLELLTPTGRTVIGKLTEPEAGRALVDALSNAWNRRPAVDAAPDSDALKRERHLSRDLMDLLKSIFDAPTMAAGYAILTDFSRQFWPEDPVALRAAPDLTETAKRIAWVHWMKSHPCDASEDADDLWDCLSDLDREGYLSAARAVSAPAAAPGGVEVTPGMCVAASDQAMALGVILPASYAASVLWAALSASPAAPAAQRAQQPTGWSIVGDGRKDELVEIHGTSGPIAGGLTMEQATAIVEAHGGAPAEKAETPGPEPARCGVCVWMGDATELGEEGECGGDENCTGRPTEITDPADMLDAWLGSEGLICGEALAASGLIEQKPATAEEAAQLDIEEGDTVWDVTAEGNALLDARRASAPATRET